jgi:hypothetical protein
MWFSSSYHCTTIHCNLLLLLLLWLVLKNQQPHLNHLLPIYLLTHGFVCPVWHAICVLFCCCVAWEIPVYYNSIKRRWNEKKTITAAWQAASVSNSVLNFQYRGRYNTGISKMSIPVLAGVEVFSRNIPLPLKKSGKFDVKTAVKCII